MSSTRISRHVNARRATVYRALLDARAVATWMVPTGMTGQVHAFDPREGGSSRISLTYDAPTGTGKTTAHTDTYHGRFVKLVPNEQVVEVVEFETTDPALRGEMTITITLVDADGGTDILAVHDGLPRGLSTADNEVGWRMSLAKLAALVDQPSVQTDTEELTLERRPIIGVMGAGEPEPATIEAAHRLGRLAAEAGWAVLTGGRPVGVMEAACAGAKAVPGSLTIGILPTGPDGPVSVHVDVAIFTGLGDARNAVNVLSSDVVVACGVEGPGTASEVALALKAGRPTVLLRPTPTAAAFFRAVAGRGVIYEVATPEAAIVLIEQELGVPRWRAV